MTENPRLEIWAGAELAQIRDADQEGMPLVCQVLKERGETVSELQARAKALAELIEIGWAAKYRA